ncbi:lipoprotein [Actinoallomurus bryophytorum]|uniref:Castor and Pollux protein voltage-gated ion channel component n=1 Tax=Actinoallomurus bryophytorum TaxID=1490222 RepID=A0A543CM63_9ACTN|nr:potassium transporter TrkA [Actinoallomurus bryophytorum]TQL98182.1 Castor and Pollux protein voltage-gated ion channel component [Actinoallomurus bryophytorum]
MWGIRLAQVRLRDRGRYAFDNTMSKGPSALIGWLGLASAILIVVFASLTVALTPGDAGHNGHWPGMLWRTLMRAIDPGTVGGDTGSPMYLALMLAVTVGGIFIVSALIGVLTTGLETKIADLRKGHSKIIERNHTVLLGWSDQVFTVISELGKANESQRRSCVAILADQDKVDMEEAIRRHVDLGNTRVVCRRGDPLKVADLDLVSPDTARSIMVIAPPAEDPDTHVIKVLLSLGARDWSSHRPSVVAAVTNSANLPAARLAGGSAAHVIDADDIGVRLVVQSHRQSGLSTVCTDLLDFSGNEFYLRSEPSLTGKTFGDALDAYELGISIGLRRTGGTVLVNPPMDTVIETDDQLIVLAEDDLLVRLAAGPPQVVTDAISTTEPEGAKPARTLLVGWNQRAPKIISLLDAFAQPGSVLDVAAFRDDPRKRLTDPAHLTIGFTSCDPTDRAALEALDAGSYQHVIVLSDDAHAPQHADARTLVTLLHLRDMEERIGDPYSIVSELNDEGNREVAQVTRADDFVVSARLISLLLTQLTENHHLRDVFASLLDPTGSEIYLKPATDYLLPGTPANFATVIEAARRRGQTALGYRRREEFHRSPAYGVVLNPDKAAPLTLSADDRVIVLSEQ